MVRYSPNLLGRWKAVIFAAALGIGDELGVDADLLGFPVLAQEISAGDAYHPQ